MLFIQLILEGDLLKIKYIAICLVLLCCIIGTASAADDVSIDAVDASVDDAVIADAVIDDTDDSTAVEEAPVDTISDDTAAEEIYEETQTDEISEESAIVDSELIKASSVLNTECSKTYPRTIYLSGVINATSKITFKNSATIIGNSGSYITGGTSSITPFYSTGSYDITFKNVSFKNMDAWVLMELATSGHNKIINCSFDNIHTYAFQSSVIWNHGGWMTITGSNFTNCNDSFGVITNHLTYNTVFMNVENCKFVNNFGRYEPGAINNCGIMNVTDCTFVNNRAAQWAGAIHTHSNAYSRIVGSNFTNNVAGTNGGALFSYSTLEVINSTFTGNNATNNGGAICGYSYGSTYNISVDSCNFTNNKVTSSSGNGGAIGAINLGYLNIGYSNFTNNSANNGQAIAAVTQTIENGTTGNPILKIFNNTFVNHTGTSNTVVISGNDYIFENNTFINSVQTTNYLTLTNSFSTLNNLNNPPKNMLRSSSNSPALKDENDEIYVDISNIEGEISDTEFTEAMGEICDAFIDAFMQVNDGGSVYLYNGTYLVTNTDQSKNITIVGLEKGKVTVKVDGIYNFYISLGPVDLTTNVTQTFKNIVFDCPIEMSDNLIFINCSFNSPINVGKNYYSEWTGSPSNFEALFTDSFALTFTDCEFNNYNIEGSLIEAFRFSIVNFNNCTFNNVNANSIVNNTGGFFTQDSINFNECIFNNVNIKGIVDVPTGTTPVERYRIEGCKGVESFGTVTEGDRDYANTTQSRTETVLVADIDDAGNLFVKLTDASGNAMAEDEVLISVNGAEAVPYALGADGTLSIALTNLTDATGKLDIAVTFEENDDYKGSSDSTSAVLVVKTVTETINPVATSITASDITATAKIGKTLSITLKDANGKILANKAIKVTVNGKTSTVTTDKNGVAKVNVNYAKAGTYYYTLSFLGDNDYKASMKAVKVTVNKQATKATFAKKTFKVKATKKLTFTLKDAKGKAIKGKKITFTVNKKTYTAKTNAKGIATVKVKLTKKGKYTAVAKFAGDTTYKAISKKATITVK